MLKRTDKTIKLIDLLDVLPYDEVLWIKDKNGINYESVTADELLTYSLCGVKEYFELCLQQIFYTWVDYKEQHLVIILQ